MSRVTVPVKSGSSSPTLQANVLIDQFGRVRLTDYGFAPINTRIALTAPQPAAGNTVWLAPEIIGPGGIVESESADIFAFAMLAFEILTGQLPFEGQGHSSAAYLILKGCRPGFPRDAEDVGLTPQMWEFLQRCWHQDPMERPTIDEVVRTWERFIGDDESAQGASNDQNHGAPVPDEEHLLGGPQTRLGKHLLSSIDIASLSA